MPQTITTNTAPTTTTRAGRIQPTADDCAQAGCLQHCACQPKDPWLYALAGTAVGGLVFGGVLYYVGKRKRTTRRR